MLIRTGRNKHFYIQFEKKRITFAYTFKDMINNWIANLDKGIFALPAKALLSWFLVISPSLSYAELPTGYTVTSGTASFVNDGTTLSITASNKAIIDYKSFNIGAQNTVNIYSALSLHRVAAGNPSQILGQLNSNGQVFLINPSGIIFGQGAQVNVQGLVASTLNIKNEDFLANRFIFQRDTATPSGAIINNGQIKATDSVALIGGAINNTGQIAAPQIAFAVGDQVTYQVSPEIGINLTINESLKQKVDDHQAAIQNSGLLQAQQIALQAKLAQAFYQTTVNNSGVIKATGLALNSTGQIVAIGQTDDKAALVQNSGTMEATGPVNGGDIHLEGDTTLNSGSIVATGQPGGKGGSVQMLGDNVQNLSGANIDASGDQGGGTILIGGDYQGLNPQIRNASFNYIDRNARLSANAMSLGNGGKVIAWANDKTIFNGSIEAKGGSSGGNGGFVETSGHQILQAEGSVEAGAPVGQAGQWLLDPNNITISSASNANVSSSGTNPVSYTTTNDNAVVSSATIQAALNAGTSVTIQTGASGSNTQAGNITVNAGTTIAKTTGGDATLTLKAHNSIVMSGTSANRINITSSSNKLGIILNSDSDASGAGAINLNYTNLTSNGGEITLGGGANPLTTNATGESAYPVGIGMSNSVLSASTGNISLRGKGYSGLDNNNFGFALGNNSQVNTTGGNISIYAEGGGANSGMNNTGANLNGTSAKISTDTGNIYITAQGSKTATGLNIGANIQNSFQISSTGSGNIFLTFISGVGTGSYPLAYNSGNIIFGSNTMSGNINITADDAKVISSGALKFQTAGNLILKPYTDSTNITLSTTDATWNSNNWLSYVDRSTVSPSRLIIGNSTGASGTTTISSGWNPGWTVPIEIYGGSLTTGSINNGTASILLGSVTGNLTLNSGTTLTSTASGNAIVLSAGQNFVNNSNSSVLNTSNGRWLVYSSSPTNTTLGGLTSYTKRYNRTFASNTPATIAESGNVVMYSIAPVLTLTANNQTKVYGDNNPALSGTLSGFIDGDTASTATSGSGSFTTSATNSSDVGTYSITGTVGTLASSMGYQFNNSVIGASLSVTPAPLTVTANNSSRLYGASNPSFSASYSGFVLGQDSSVLGGSLSLNTAATSSSNVGNYSITPSGLTSSNYSITNVAGTLAVNPAPLTVTANNASRLYGASNPSFSASYSGFVLGQDSSVLGGSLSLNTSATSSSNVGNYSITPSGLTSSNYSITNVDGTLAVNPAPLTVTANNASRLYGASNPSFSASYSGFVLGQDSSVLSGGFSTSATSSSNVGNYSITPAFTSSNYSITNVAGTLAVNPAPLTVTANNASRLYGASNPSFSASYSGFVLGQDSSVLSGGFSTSATSSSNVGNYSITPAFTSSNYSITNVDGTLAVNPAPLTVTANNASRLYGASNPSFSASYSGFVMGQDTSVLGGSLSLSTPATSSSNVGNYSITPSGLTSSNYSITNVDGTLSITPLVNTTQTASSSSALKDVNTPYLFSSSQNPTISGLDGRLSTGQTVDFQMYQKNYQMNQQKSLMDTLLKVSVPTAPGNSGMDRMSENLKINVGKVDPLELFKMIWKKQNNQP